MHTFMVNLQELARYAVLHKQAAYLSSVMCSFANDMMGLQCALSRVHAIHGL